VDAKISRSGRKDFTRRAQRGSERRNLNCLIAVQNSNTSFYSTENKPLRPPPRLYRRVQPERSDLRPAFTAACNRSKAKTKIVRNEQKCKLPFQTNLSTQQNF